VKTLLKKPDGKIFEDVREVVVCEERYCMMSVREGVLYEEDVT
jgi:hypothetical protein